MPGGERKNANPMLLVALAGGATVQEAAQRAGVGEATVYRRLKAPTFQRKLRAARSAMVERAVGKLSEASTEAVDTLQELLQADGETVRLGACRAILELGSKLRESTEYAERITALEAALPESADKRSSR